MGAFGPKRVEYKDDEGHAAPPPYRTVDNEGTILDVADLVFLDHRSRSAAAKPPLW